MKTVIAILLASLAAACTQKVAHDPLVTEDAPPASAHHDEAAPPLQETTSALPEAPAAPPRWTCTFDRRSFGSSTSQETNCSDSDVHVTVTYVAQAASDGSLTVTVDEEIGWSDDDPSSTSSRMFSGEGTAVSFADELCANSWSDNPGTWAYSLDEASSMLTAVYADADLTAGSVIIQTNCKAE